MNNKKTTTSEGRQSYTQEFRDEAVRLTVTSGKPVAQIARDLGIGSHRLYEWRREARYAHRLPVAESETPEQQIKRLQKENDLLKQERDILKNYSAAVRSCEKRNSNTLQAHDRGTWPTAFW